MKKISAQWPPQRRAYSAAECLHGLFIHVTSSIFHLWNEKYFKKNANFKKCSKIVFFTCEINS